MSEVSTTTETPDIGNVLLAAGLARFRENFRNGSPSLQDSVMWYCLDMGIDWYLALPIHERINFKESYFAGGR